MMWSFISIRLLVLVTALSFTLPGYADSRVEITNSQTEYALAPTAEWLIDDRTLLSFDDIQRRYNSGQFNPLKSSNFRHNHVAGTLWIHLALRTAADISTPRWYLQLSDTQIDSVQLYQVNAEQQRGGKISPAYVVNYAERPFSHRALAAPLTLPVNTDVDLYIAVRSDGPIRLPLTLLSTDALAQQNALAETVQGVYLGIVFCLLLFSILAYLHLRNKNYLYHIAFLLALCLLQVSANGFGFQFFWPDSLIWQRHSAQVSILLFTLSAIRFAVHFLQTQRNVAAHHWLLLLLTAANGCLVLLTPLLPINLHVQLTVVTAFVTSIVLCVTGMATWLRNHLVTAKLFTVSWLMVIIGSVIHILMMREVLPSNSFTVHCAQLLILVSAIILSMALGRRMRELREEKRSKQAESQNRTELTNRHLNEIIQEIEQSNRLKDQLLSIISHELRTPMNGVEGSLALIESDKLDKKQRNYLRTAIASAQEMTGVIDSILRFSELQSGNIEIRNEHFELRTTLSPMEVFYRNQCHGKKIDFDWQIDRNVPIFIFANAEYIELIMRQLLDESLRYTHSGRISANISYAELPGSDARKLLISIVDSSNFEQRCEAQLTPDTNQSNNTLVNLGMGIPMCQYLARRMDGDLTFDPMGDGGTLATLVLPLSPTSLAELTTGISGAAKVQYVVLIVEDNPINMAVLEGMLQKHDYILLKAENGKQALDILNQQPVDLVLMDCQMPEMDGFTATHHIRSSKRAYSYVPIIAVTANAMSKDHARCVAAGMNDYIKKPVSREILEEKMSRWLKSTDLHVKM